MPTARDRWKPLVDALEASSLSLTEFARRAGVNHNTLAWWRPERLEIGRTADRSAAPRVRAT